MSENVEVIDSMQMEVLSEFQSEIEKGEEFQTSYRLGVLNNDFIVSVQSTIAHKPQGKIIPQGVDERVRRLYQRDIARNWWGGTVLFELGNFDGVLQRLEEIYGERPARKIDLNEYDIVNGKDQLGVRKNSVMPNNVGQPIVTTQISNTRFLEMDDVRKNGWDLYLTPETGLKLMDEMHRIRPVIQQKLANFIN